MAKRFTDTTIWEKQWFMDFTPQQKCAFMYIKDRCDQIGVWDANTKLAEFVIGEEIDWNKLVKDANGNIVILKSGKWWLKDFCQFQYGELTEKSPPHKKYIEMLKKAGLYQRVVKGYSKGNNTLQEKEEEKEEEEAKEKDIKKSPTIRFQKIHEEVMKQPFSRLSPKETKKILALDEDFGQEVVDKAWKYFLQHQQKFVVDRKGSKNVHWFVVVFDDIIDSQTQGKQKPADMTWEQWWNEQGKPE